MPHPSRNEDGREKNLVDMDMELRRRLLSCMAETLTNQQYQVFVLNFLEGMSQKEIAEEFGMSYTSVSRSLAAAKHRLRISMGYRFVSDDPDANAFDDGDAD